MQILSVPARLKLAAAAAFLSVPAVGLETLLALKAPWWRIPYASLTVSCGIAAALSGAVALLVLRGKRIALQALLVVDCLWILGTGWLAFALQNPGLAFYMLFVIGLCLAYYFWLRFEMSRSFLDPGVRWFQGLPKPIPGLACELVHSGKREPMRVSRLDSDGACVFAMPGHEAPRSSSWDAELVFTFRDRQVQCRGSGVSRFGDGAGIGFQFSGMSPDARKALGDFVENLRGEGHG